MHSNHHIVPDLSPSAASFPSGISARIGRVLREWGGLLHRRDVPPTRSTKVWASVVLGGCLGLWVVAASLTPASAGVGTHQQLGLAPCSLLSLSGYPCPTCGMTTAFSLAVRGRFFAAFTAQPAGLVFAMLTAFAAAQAISALWLGRVWTLDWYRVTPNRLIASGVAVVLGSWAYKVITCSSY